MQVNSFPPIYIHFLSTFTFESKSMYLTTGFHPTLPNNTPRSTSTSTFNKQQSNIHPTYIVLLPATLLSVPSTHLLSLYLHFSIHSILFSLHRTTLTFNKQQSILLDFLSSPRICFPFIFISIHSILFALHHTSYMLHHTCYMHCPAYAPPSIGSKYGEKL